MSAHVDPRMVDRQPGNYVVLEWHLTPEAARATPSGVLLASGVKAVEMYEGAPGGWGSAVIVLQGSFLAQGEAFRPLCDSAQGVEIRGHTRDTPHFQVVAPPVARVLPVVITGALGVGGVHVRLLAMMGRGGMTPASG